MFQLQESQLLDFLAVAFEFFFFFFFVAFEFDAENFIFMVFD